MSGEVAAGFQCEYPLTKLRGRGLSRKEPASHQSEALDKLRQWFDKGEFPAGGILVLPTGGGKTFVAVRFLCTGPLSAGYKVLWLAHTHHLLEQAFHAFGPGNGGGNGGNGCEAAWIAEPKSALRLRVVSGTPGHCPVHQVDAGDDVVIGTLQTVARAFNDPEQRGLKEFLDSAGEKLFVVFDEAHHSPAPSYQRLLVDLSKAHPRMYLLGLTATPTYTDEKRRGWLKKLFPQGIVSQALPSHLMANSILAEPVFEEPRTKIAPDFDEREYRKWVGTYRDLPESVVDQLARNRDRNAFIAETYVANKERYGKTIVFADRWFQCEQLSEMLRLRGVRTGAIYSRADADPGSAEARNKRRRDENSRVLQAFRRGELDVLLNVRMLTEGTDVPDVRTVFLTRQTTSRILLTQMVGRALRGPKFGGTEKAYIVSFIDDWKKAINWAGYDQLAEGLADDSVPEYGSRPPLQLISIELVQRLARQMDSGLNVAPGPFLSLMPAGWYRVEFQTLAEGTESLETVRQLIMVAEDERESYRRFIEHLAGESLEELAHEAVEAESHRERIEKWRDRFFAADSGSIGGDLVANLFHVARHMAQGDGDPPAFFPFADRESHDLDRIARRFSFEDKLDALSLHRSLMAEYHRRDRYWSVIYFDPMLFKSQYDACVNRMLRLELDPGGAEGAGPLPVPSRDESSWSREPSEEVKEQAKARDGYRCLCCGENGKRLLEIDHVAPSYYGGNSSLENLQTLCRTCNGIKGINTLNFHVHRSALLSPPSKLSLLGSPRDAASRKEWEKCLRRSVNFFYGCSAVDSVKIGQRGKYFHEWLVYLYAGNDPAWLEPRIGETVREINALRSERRLKEIRGIRVDAPDLPEAAWLRRESDGGIPVAETKALEIWIEPVTGMEFARVPGGSYRMGCGRRTGECEENEKPSREVRLDGFWMARHPVTQGQWERIMGENPSCFRKGDSYPVENVSWKDAKAFVEKLISENGERYKLRLPTEAEWEYACRSGGRNERYAGGDDADSAAWHAGNSRGSTHPVGAKAPNGLGLCDMSGNVWEWCEDVYDKSAYWTLPRDNPLCTSGSRYRVCRGGSWKRKDRDARSTNRDFFIARYRTDDLGFRLARED